jgi:hypothetical protein
MAKEAVILGSSYLGGCYTWYQLLRKLVYSIWWQWLRRLFYLVATAQEAVLLAGSCSEIVLLDGSWL